MCTPDFSGAPSRTGGREAPREPMSRLREVGLRPTRQRLALARILLDGCDRHVTAESLHDEALAQGVSLSLATVYNTLHQFTDCGLLRQVVVASDRSYFDTNTSSHHHFFDEDRCVLTDIPGTQVLVSDLPPAPPGSRISQVDVVVRVRSDDNPALR